MHIANPIGRKGEALAKDLLLKKGYTILETNFRKKYAEIDIIAIHKNTLVFIEVKTRTSRAFGLPIESISYFKLQLLMRTAQLYKQFHPKLPGSMRMDAIVITLSKNEEVLEIEHVENITG